MTTNRLPIAETKRLPLGPPLDIDWPKDTGTILDLVGNTPLHELKAGTFAGSKGIELWVKLEGHNPGGSIKDRPATLMLHHGLTTGKLRPGKTILDSTSGNTGIALAMLGAALGYPVTLTISARVSEEKRDLLRAYGVNLVVTDAASGSDGAILKAQEIYASAPEKYFTPDQYNNPANAWSHYLSTAPEIWHQTNRRLTHLVAPIGTGGTVTGNSMWFREHAPHVRIIAVEPDAADHGLNGMRHIPSTIRPGIYDENAFDQLMRVSTDDAYEMARSFARREGLVIGASAAACLVAASELILELDAGVVVTICPDKGDRYLSTSLFKPRPLLHEHPRP